MRSMIIDDEAPNRENLCGLLQRYCPDISVVSEAGSIETGLMLIQKHHPELLFLDIQLHGRSGFELLKQLEQINFEIIFVTAYDQYGIQAVKFSALDYLLKPIDVEELQAAVQKARVKLSQRKTNDRLEYLVSYLKSGKETPLVIALPLQDEIRYVPVGDIIRCEASNTYTYFYLQGGEKSWFRQKHVKYFPRSPVYSYRNDIVPFQNLRYALQPCTCRKRQLRRQEPAPVRPLDGKGCHQHLQNR